MIENIQFGDIVYYPEITYVKNDNKEYIQFQTKCNKWNEYLYNTIYHPLVFRKKEIVDEIVNLLNKYHKKGITKDVKK